MKEKGGGGEGEKLFRALQSRQLEVHSLLAEPANEEAPFIAVIKARQEGRTSLTKLLVLMKFLNCQLQLHRRDCTIVRLKKSASSMVPERSGFTIH